MTDISRNPTDYYPSVHCQDQRKWRDIKWEDVSTTIEEGTVHVTGYGERFLIIKDFSHTEEPIGVVVRPDGDEFEIVTVEWRTEPVPKS